MTIQKQNIEYRVQKQNIEFSCGCVQKEFLVIYLRADTKWGKQDYIGRCTQSNDSGIKWLTPGFEGLRGNSAKGGTPYFLERRNA